MSLRDIDHTAVRAFLRDLETKGLPGGFSGYGGGSFGALTGVNGAIPYIRTMLPGAKYDYELEAGETWRNSAVAACLGWIERNFPEPRTCVLRRKSGRIEEEIDDHPALSLLANPNDFYDGDLLWAAVNVSWHVDGNAYLLKGRTVGGATKQLYFLPHWQVFPRWPTDGSAFISHYEYIVDGRRTSLRPNQVVHFRNGLDINCYRYGWSKLKTALREVCTDNEAAGFSATILRNMGVPGFILQPEGADDVIEKEDRDTLKEQWREEFTGEGRGGLMVNSVRVKLQQITMTPEQLVLDKIRAVPEARICAAIGIDAMVTGLSVSEKSRKFSNYQEARRAAYDDCIVPTQKQLAKQFTKQMPELFKTRQRLSWDYSDVAAMQEDATAKAKRAVVLFQGRVGKLNESRSIAGLPPDTNPEGEKYFDGATQIKGAEPGIAGNSIGGKDE